MSDDDLFAIPARARRSDPETSHEAAASIDPHTANIRAAVRNYAIDLGEMGFTDEQLSAHFGETDTSSYRTRRAELTVAGEIVDSGRRENNSRGRACIVWVWKDFAPKREPLRPPVIKPDTSNVADCFRLLDACVDQMRRDGWLAATAAKEALQTLRKAVR